MSGPHHQKRNRRPRQRSQPYDQAFRGTMKRRKARWESARRRLAQLRTQPTVRAIFATLFDVALERLGNEGVYLGLGGFRNDVDKARVEASRSAGRGPQPGLADLSGCSRRSAVRFRHRIVDLGLCMLVVGGGRGHANEYRLDDGGPPPDPLPPEPKEGRPDPERMRALLQEATRRIGGPRGP